MPAVSDSALRVPYSRIRELAEIAMRMDGVLRLYFGESNLPTPEFIKRAAAKALDDGYTYYTANAGLPSLRHAIADNYQRLQQVRLDPENEIVITASGVQALNVAIRTVLDPGDEALILTPAWPNGSAIVQMANATPVHIAAPPRRRSLRIDFDALERAITPRPACFCTPRRRTRWAGPRPKPIRIACWTSPAARLWLLADEVYDRLYYAGRAWDPVRLPFSARPRATMR